MKDYARFLTESGTPVVRSQGRGDSPAGGVVAPDQQAGPKPRPFDRKRQTTPSREPAPRTYGAYGAYGSYAKSEGPTLKELAERNTSPHDVTVIPDSWPMKDHYGETPHAPTKLPAEPGLAETETKQRPGPKKKVQHKRRRVAMSISVSEEEEFILRTYAAKRNQSFSEWARTVMFRSMGRKVPDRS